MYKQQKKTKIFQLIFKAYLIRIANLKIIDIFLIKL